MAVDKKLLEYCETVRQKEIVESWIKHNGNCRSASKSLGINKGGVQKTIKRIKANAAKKGYAPEFDLKHPVADPFIVHGTSTLYNKDGEVTSQWVKTTIDNSKYKDILAKLINEYSQTIPKYEPSKRKNQQNCVYEDKLVVYPLADIHLGMLSWVQETGNDYNCKIADEIVRRNISKLMDRTPSCEECLIVNLGDLLHMDNQVHQTERSGNVLDVDGRYARVMDMAIKMIRYCIEYALMVHGHVTVINCIGNHDDLGALWLQASLKNIYENEDCLTIHSSPTPRHYYNYGNTLIGCTHGSDIKSQDLPLVMATECPEKWSNSKYRYWYTGHIHHDSLKEIGNVKVESFRAICAKDAWSNSKGYNSGRDMKAIVIDPDYGETERYTISIS